MANVFDRVDALVEEYESLESAGRVIVPLDKVLGDMRALRDERERRKYRLLEDEFGEAWHRAFMD